MSPLLKFKNPFALKNPFLKPSASGPAASAKPPKKISTPFTLFPAWKSPGGPSTQTLIFHFTESGFRVLLLGLAGPLKRELVEVLNLKTEEFSEEAALQKIQALLAESKIKNPRLIGVVSSFAAITRNIEIPSRNPHEIREIINLQAGRHTPYSRNEIVADYLDLGIFKSIYTRILLVIVPRSAVKRYYDLAVKLGLHAEKIVFASEGVARYAARRLKLENETVPFTLVLVDRTATEFTFIQKGLVLFARSVPIGAQNFLEEKEAAQTKLIEELKRSFDAYQGENLGEMPRSVILTGMLKPVEGLDALIQEQLKMEVKLWQAEEALPFRSEGRAQPAERTVAWLASAAPALMIEDLSIDLTPQEYKLKRSVEERSREIVKTGVLAIINLGLVSAILLSHLYFRHARIEALAQRFEPIRAEAKTLEEAHHRLETIHGHISEQGRAIESLSELYNLMPTDVYLTDIRYEEGKKFTIKGTALARGSIFTLVGGMEDSIVFKNVETKYVSGRTEDGKELSDFEILAAFE